jgi:hypothetical protein
MLHGCTDDDLCTEKGAENLDEACKEEAENSEEVVVLETSLCFPGGGRILVYA